MAKNITLACEEANRLRKEWKAGMRPGRRLFDLAGDQGVLVFRMSLNPSLSGAFVRSRRKRLSAVIVNSNQKNLHHQLFTLAHELGHLQLHEDRDGLVEEVDETADGAAKTTEQEANAFAAELLVPLKELSALLAGWGISAAAVSDPAVIDLACQFDVSHHVILRRLRILSRATPRSVHERLKSVEWNALWKTYAPARHADTIPERPSPTWSPEGVSPATAITVSRLPLDYRNMAFEAYRRGKITAAKLAEILGLPGKDVVVRELRPLLKPESAKMDAENLEALKRASRLKEE